MSLVTLGVLGVSLATSPVGDHAYEVVAGLPPLTIAPPDAEFVSTTNNDPKLTVGYWTFPTWYAQERAEEHRPDQEQPTYDVEQTGGSHTLTA